MPHPLVSVTVVAHVAVDGFRPAGSQREIGFSRGFFSGGGITQPRCRRAMAQLVVRGHHQRRGLVLVGFRRVERDVRRLAHHRPIEIHPTPHILLECRRGRPGLAGTGVSRPGHPRGVALRCLIDTLIERERIAAVGGVHGETGGRGRTSRAGLPSVKRLNRCQRGRETAQISHPRV